MTITITDAFHLPRPEDVTAMGFLVENRSRKTAAEPEADETAEGGRVACVAVIAFLLASAAGLATAQPQSSSRNELRVEGSVLARDVTIRLDCDRDGQHLSCVVRQRFELSAGATGARLLGPAAGVLLDYAVTVNGEPSSGDVLLGAGESATFDVQYRVQTPRGSALLVPAVDLRHVVLGEGERFHRQRLALPVPVLAGEGVEIEGGVTIEANAPGLDVHVGGDRVGQWPHRSQGLPALAVGRHREAEAFANGGPVVALGGRFDLDAPGERFWLAAGYEVALFEHLIASLWLETDLESISEALLIEVALPGLFVLPSLSAGAGLVLTQLGPRQSDAALRIRLALSSYVVGVIADFDYFPSTGTWTAGVAARIGI